MRLHLHSALLAAALLAFGGCGGGDSQNLDPDVGLDQVEPADLPSPPDTTPDGALELKPQDGGPETEVNGECRNNDDCPGAYCLEYPPGSDYNICAEPCVEECADEGDCCKLVTLPETETSVSVCVPCSAKAQCVICKKDSECAFAGSRCVRGSAPFGYCVDRCDGPSDGACANGFECRSAPQELNDGLFYCQPKPQSCCVSGELHGCDDGNPCTEEYCGPALGCLYRPQEGECSGADPCQFYTCLEGVCQGFPVTEDPDFDGVDDDCDGSTDEDVWRYLQILHHNYGGGAGWMNGPGIKLWSEVNSPSYEPSPGLSQTGELKLRPGMPLNP